MNGALVSARGTLRAVALSSFVLALTGHGPVLSQSIPQPLCPLAIHEERLDLELYRLDVELARSDFAAFEKIFRMIEELWKSGAIERMVYVEAKYDRDAAELALEQAGLILQRQETLIEQYRATCEKLASEEEDPGADRRHLRYLQSHCDSLAKSVEVSTVQLEYDKELLASVLDLRAGEVATRIEVILAELDVEKEKKRLEDAMRRTAACRRELTELKGASSE
jgi:hypothetical protein